MDSKSEKKWIPSTWRTAYLGVFGLIFLLSRTSAVFLPKEYDFIVVGGGTAGCLVANRLSENPDWKILLIEAGGEENILQDVPLAVSLLEFTPSDWKYRAERDSRYCRGLKLGRCHWPRGRVLGGTSVLNYMTYVRGNRNDFDNWEALGNTGWGYDDVLPYFLKFEDMTIPEFSNDTKYHSTKGELTISNPPFHTELATAFLDAGIERGYKYVDYNLEKQVGYSYLQSTMKGGLRMSSNRAFLEPVRNRKNLDVETRSLATKILIHENNKTAYGLEYRKWGIIKKTAIAKKEVVLTAGAINTPQLLMISGVGPKDHLKEMEINVLQDSKVGYNFMDHVTFANLFYTVNESVGIRLDKPLNAIKALTDLLLSHTGLLTIPGGSETIGFEDLDDSDGYPEIELLFAGTTSASMHIFWQSMGGRTDILYESYPFLHFMDAYMILPIYLKPKSRGRIMLKDKSPFVYPAMYPNYFEEREDIEGMIKAVRIASVMANTSALNKYGAKLFPNPLLQCSNYKYDSDAYWECSIRYMTFSLFHFSGTCKMGPDSDPDAVVDTRLRVRGIKNLRIADASIMPVITSGHIQGPIYMIAQRATDMIKEDWSSK